MRNHTLVAIAASIAIGAAGASADEDDHADEGHHDAAVMAGVGEAGRAEDVTRTVVITAIDNLFEPESLEVAAGETVRFVVTNLADDPRTLYDERYTARGDMENRIKEQQLGLFADRTRCHRFLANPFPLLLASAAYVLIEHLRRMGLKGTELAKAQVTTIRTQFFKIAARVTVSVRRIVFHLSSYYPYQQLFALLVHRLTPI